VKISFGFVESVWSGPISGRLFLCDYINPPIIFKLLGQEICTYMHGLSYTFHVTCPYIWVMENYWEL